MEFYFFILAIILIMLFIIELFKSKLYKLKVENKQIFFNKNIEKKEFNKEIITINPNKYEIYNILILVALNIIVFIEYYNNKNTNSVITFLPFIIILINSCNKYFEKIIVFENGFIRKRVFFSKSYYFSDFDSLLIYNEYGWYDNIKYYTYSFVKDNIKDVNLHSINYDNLKGFDQVLDENNPNLEKINLL